MLETRKVFIDSQYFVRSGLHFDTQAFKAFQKYCEVGELQHISTSVVQREVRSKIGGAVQEALNAIQTFRRKVRLLASIDDEKIKALFVDLDHEDIQRKSLAVMDEYMNACRTATLDAANINAEELLSLYFEKKPPFGERKKKAEFPDAISLLALKSSLEEGEKIYVVSADGDLNGFCELDPKFVCVESLDKLLDIYTTHTSVRHDKAKRYVDDNQELIKQKIQEYLEGCDVYNVSTWEDAEVDGGLRVVNLGDIEPNILFIDDEECQITFDIDVEFEVTVTGPDFNNGIYDREDDRMYTFDSTTKNAIVSATYTVELFLYYSFVDGQLENVEIEGLYIPGASSGIEVDVEENDSDW